MRRTHPTRDPWQGCNQCHGAGIVPDGDFAAACPDCSATGYVLRPGWRIYRPRRKP